jgi:hypothetical protein
MPSGEGTSLTPAALTQRFSCLKRSLVLVKEAEKRIRSNREVIDSMVRPERFELPTLWFEAKCSIQLSYGRMLANKLNTDDIHKHPPKIVG